MMRTMMDTRKRITIKRKEPEWITRPIYKDLHLVLGFIIAGLVDIGIIINWLFL
jgi:hypothetical protein